jgi:ABC-type transport system involved in multi-copper enzyme maturation permease subunit
MQTIWAIARNTLGDSLRKRVVLIFQGLGIVMLFLALLLRYFTSMEQNVLFASTQLYIILVFGGLIGITTAVFLVPAELDTRTIYGVLSKPVTRTQFFLGKYLGGLLTVTIMVAMMVVALVLVLCVCAFLPYAGSGGDLSHPEGTEVLTGMALASREILAVLRGAAMIWFQLAIVLAIATTLSLVLTTTVNFALSTFIWILGSLQWVVLALANRNEQGLFIIPIILKGAYYITPHFDDLNFMAGMSKPEILPKLSPAVFAGAVSVYHVLYAAVILLIGSILFDKREV